MVDIAELTVSILPLILLVFFIHKWRRSCDASSRRKNFPPSPSKLPIIGNLHQLGRHPHRSLQFLSKRHGELMQLHFCNVGVVVASSAAAAGEIMKTQDSIFASRPKLNIADRLSYGSRSMAFSGGEYWKKVRSICVLQVLSHKRVQSFRAVREEETSLMVDKIKNSASVVNLTEVLSSLTNGIVCRAALGKKYDDDGEGRKFQKLLAEFVELMGSFSVGDYVPWLGWINRINGLIKRVEIAANVLGYDIARGTHVLINVWAISRDPLLWKDPEEFHPERFLESSIDLKGQHLQFTPFGAGRRSCPGITFALAVNELALAKLVHNFNFALPNGERAEDLDMTEATGITVRRKYPLLVIANPTI